MSLPAAAGTVRALCFSGIIIACTGVVLTLPERSVNGEPHVFSGVQKVLKDMINDATTMNEAEKEQVRRYIEQRDSGKHR